MCLHERDEDSTARAAGWSEGAYDLGYVHHRATEFCVCVVSIFLPLS